MPKVMIILTLLCASLVMAGEGLFVQDRLLVRFQAEILDEDMDLILFDSGLTVEKKLVRSLNVWSIHVDLTKFQLHEAKRWLEQQPEVIYVQYDHYLQERLEPNDPLFSNQWNFHNTGQGGGVEDADIDALEAWDITTGGVTALGDSIVAAVVDNGFDMDHPDLVANIWVNDGDFPNNGIDEDFNGYIDDTYGWNAFDSNGNIPEQSHGTHVAGTIGAHTNNENQVAGINWRIKLMTVAGASTQTSTAMEGYGYVLDQKLAWIESGGQSGAFVVSTNSSFGIDYADCESGDYPLWNDMYNAMGSLGILSAAATANRNVDVDEFGDVPTGCGSSYLIAVTNTTKYDAKTVSAGWGAESIDLGAPGSGVFSTNYYGGSSYKSGTSMASPHVAGAVAFLHAAASEEFAQYYLNQPALASLVMKSIILSTTDSLESLQDITVSAGRLNLNSAALVIHNWVQSATGDMNADGDVNVQDLVILINIILDRVEATAEQEIAADLNSDEIITVQDLVLLATLILN
jgi:subtilisin family serine protease